MAGGLIAAAGAYGVYKLLKPPVEVPIYDCPFCDLMFYTQTELTSHIAVAHPSNPHYYDIDVGFALFGDNPSYFDLPAALEEFQDFVEANCKLRINWISSSQYSPVLTSSELVWFENHSCQFASPATMKASSLAFVPSNVVANVVYWDIQSIKVCYAGLAYPPVIGCHGIATCFVPYGDSISWWAVEHGWTHKTSYIAVHEFTHSLFHILEQKGFSGLPNPDAANSYGFTEQNDPGWLRFRAWCLKQLTDEMCAAIVGGSGGLLV